MEESIQWTIEALPPLTETNILTRREGGGVSKKFLSKVLFYRRDAKSVVNDLLDGPTFSWIYDLAPPPPPLAKFQRHITNRGGAQWFERQKSWTLYISFNILWVNDIFFHGFILW
jgi:hypothetical protein